MGGKDATREKPINLRAWEVRAILDGRKTQTRRPIKLVEFQPADTPGYDWMFRDKRMLWHDVTTARLIDRWSPYKPGDRLWVRETWAHDADSTEQARRAYEDLMGPIVGYGPYWKATDPYLNVPWRPSVHMPRWASRITLEVLSVRPERVQEISDDDAKAEGVETIPAFADGGWPWESYTSPVHSDVASETAVLAFSDIWNSIHGDGAWDANPWVWRVEFRRIDAEAAA